MAGGASHVLEKGLRTDGGQCPARVGKSVVENVNHGRRLWGGLPLGIDLSVKNIAGKLWPCGRCASVCVCAVHVILVVGRYALWYRSVLG